MNKVNVDSKYDKEEEFEDTAAEDNEEINNTTEEKTEETFDNEDSTEEKEEFDYKVYGKETVEETKSIAEKMFNDVVSTLKTRQSEWNKTLEEYKANKPAVDVLEYDSELIIKLDAPRATKDDISIKMSTDSIEIEIDFPNYLEDDEDVKILRKERCSGKTKNIIPLPVEVDIKEVKASFDNNELTVTLPKIKGKKVDVEIL